MIAQVRYPPKQMRTYESADYSIRIKEVRLNKRYRDGRYRQFCPRHNKLCLGIEKSDIEITPTLRQEYMEIMCDIIMIMSDGDML